MVQFIRAMILCACAVLLISCNTTAGLGKDVEAAGKAIERGAKNAKKKL